MAVVPKDALPLAAFVLTLRADEPTSTRAAKARSRLSLERVEAYRDDLAAKGFVHVEYVPKGQRPFPDHKITLTPQGEALQADLRRAWEAVYGPWGPTTGLENDSS